MKNQEIVCSSRRGSDGPDLDVNVTVFGELGRERERFGVKGFLPVVGFNVQVAGEEFCDVPEYEDVIRFVKTETEACWEALEGALASFVDSVTDDWAEDWREGAGSYGWHLTIHTTSRAFYVELKAYTYDLCVTKPTDSLSRGARDRALDFLLLFSQVKLIL